MDGFDIQRLAGEGFPTHHPSSKSNPDNFCRRDVQWRDELRAWKIREWAPVSTSPNFFFLFLTWVQWRHVKHNSEVYKPINCITTWNYTAHTFSLLERAVLLLSWTFDVPLVCIILDEEALIGAPAGTPSACSDTWPLFRACLWARCFLELCTAEAHLSTELLFSECSLDIFFWVLAACWGAEFFFFSLTTSFGRSVSLAWSCFWLVRPEQNN